VRHYSSSSAPRGAWQYFNNVLEAVQHLKAGGYEIIVVEHTDASRPLRQFQPNPNKRYALVMGNEVNGVQQEVVDLARHCIEVSQFGTKHSLNIAVCAGIVIWDFYWKMQSPA